MQNPQAAAAMQNPLNAAAALQNPLNAAAAGLIKPGKLPKALKNYYKALGKMPSTPQPVSPFDPIKTPFDPALNL